jgi:uncharacterized protein
MILKKDIEELLEEIDYSNLGNNVAIKVHFGEKGCVTYISPEIVKVIYDKVISLGKKAALVECNVLYKGSRTNASDHIKTAKEHGFNFAPIDILDGEMGDEELDIIVEGLDKPAKIGKGLQKYDSMIVLTHFKGHLMAGYGGVFKNIGMGLGSRAGKLHMHSNLGPSVWRFKCTACGACFKHCNFNAITLNPKAKIDKKKCVGCAMCISVCPVGAVKVPWLLGSSKELQKKIVAYSKAVFQIIPIEKCIFINALINITRNCDCMGIKQKPIMKDIGFVYDKDPVALDGYCLKLTKGLRVNFVKKRQVEFAEFLGLGKRV